VKIRTKYTGATNTRGAVIKASYVGQRGSVTIPYDYASTDVHRDAVVALLGFDPESWGDGLVRGRATRSGRGWVFHLLRTPEWARV